MALLSLVILAMLFIVLLAGLAYLCWKVCQWSKKMGTGGNGGSIVEVQSYDGEEGPALPQGAIIVPVSSTNSGIVLRFVVEQSTNMADWEPLTNFLCAPDAFWQEWRMPIRTDEPQRFFRIGCSDPILNP